VAASFTLSATITEALFSPLGGGIAALGWLTGIAFGLAIFRLAIRDLRSKGALTAATLQPEPGSKT